MGAAMTLNCGEHIMSECLHCEINDLVRTRLDEDQANPGDLGSDRVIRAALAHKASDQGGVSQAA